MPQGDTINLARFVEAQEAVWERALAELKEGQKRTHWMWFVFPQLAGLGHSPTAQFYGLSGLDEAKAYLAHPVLGPRLIACTQAVLALRGRSLHTIFGSPDDLKFRSSMTLFDKAAEKREGAFRAALALFCDGDPDPRTLELICS